MNKIVIYPGSFDPVTYGHLDLIERGSILFDTLYIVISKNISKNALFTPEERKAMLEQATSHLSNVKVFLSDKLISDFALEVQATSLLRGLRAITDFDYELQMASTNRMLNPNLETVFMMTKTDYSYFSSSMVKEIARFKGDISKFVPPCVAEAIYEKMKIKDTR